MHMGMDSLDITLEEEIGDPRLFTGRRKDLTFFLDWVERVRGKLGQSQVILARKRRGKTALVQRLYNILYSRNDSSIIPFYFRVPEGKMTTAELCRYFTRHLLSQILGYQLRKPEYIRKPLSWEKLEILVADHEHLNDHYQELQGHLRRNDVGGAWDATREAGHHLSLAMDVRIIQMIDEFQFLNEFFYRDEAFTTRDDLATFYQKTGSSKVSPQIITGSYVGWLTRIVNHMVGRYFHYYLESLPHNEAPACVYRYAAVYGQEVTESSAAYMAAVCDNDPYYIASLFQYAGSKDLSSEPGVRTAMDNVTNPGGSVANMWLEYIQTAFQKINDRVAKQVVLYLAHHEPGPQTVQQILDGCQLEMETDVLEERLQQLAYADMIRTGVSSHQYQGLGDPVFAMVFRKRFQGEIEGIGLPQIRAHINQELKQLRGRVSYYKGMAAEERVAKKLVFLSIRGLKPANLILGPNPTLDFQHFTSAYDHVFQLPGGARIAVDIYCRSKGDGPDLVVEVKNWKERPGRPEIDRFRDIKKQLVTYLKRPTYFLFHSESPLSEQLQEYTISQDLWYSDGERLKDL